MGVVEKLKCDARNCGKEENIKLNHLWTLVLVPNQQAIIFPGMLRSLPRQLPDATPSENGEHIRYACGPECVQRMLWEWMGKVLGHQTHE